VLSVVTRAASDDGEGRVEPALPGMALRFYNTSMPELARYLGRQGPVGAPVVDETTLAGRFNFLLTLVPGEVSPEDGKRMVLEGGVTRYIDALSSIGLRLGRRGAVATIVVERAERVPTPN
jgi:uncharacterized protein (TIGR03435 family)